MYKLLLLSILLVFATACANEAPEEETPTAVATASGTIQLNEAQQELADIKVGMAERRVISNYIDCTGRIEVPPQSLISVYAPVTGFVQNVTLLPGDYVRKGSRLTTIQHPDLVKLQREFLETQSQLEFLEQDYQRKQVLAEADASSQKSMQQAKAALDLQRATYKGLKSELQLIGINVKALEEEGNIQSQLPIFAKASGYISQVNINPGKLVHPDDLLFELVDNAHMHLELQVFAKDLARLQKGQTIETWLPGTEERHEGYVHLVGKMVDMDTKTAVVHGHFAEEPSSLTPGTYVQARIQLQEQESWAVPLTAVVEAGEESFVFVQEAEGFAKRPVQLGRRNDEFVELLGWEDAEAQIVLQGAYYLNGSMGE